VREMLEEDLQVLGVEDLRERDAEHDGPERAAALLRYLQE
jgi:hypothetical protein